MISAGSLPWVPLSLSGVFKAKLKLGEHIFDLFIEEIIFLEESICIY